MSYEVLLKQNEWIGQYKGKTFTNRLADKILKGIHEEHLKKSDLIPTFKRRTLVTCYDPKTKEIESLGASSLLRNKKTGKIEMNLLNENLVRLCLLIFGRIGTDTDVNLKDTLNGANTFAGLRASSFFSGVNATPLGQFGSNGSAPTRNDFNIGTALPNAPESTVIIPSAGQIFVDEHITWQFVIANAGGAGTVREFIQLLTGKNTAAADKTLLLWHDLTNVVAYTAGKSISATVSMQF